MSHWWEITFFDGEVVTSDECSLDDLPQKPIKVIVQTGCTATEIQVNGSRYYYDPRYGWCEMESDTEALVTKLKYDVKHWICYRPGWWDHDNPRFKEEWHAAAARLEAHKDAS